MIRSGPEFFTIIGFALPTIKYIQSKFKTKQTRSKYSLINQTEREFKKNHSSGTPLYSNLQCQNNA